MQDTVSLECCSQATLAIPPPAVESMMKSVYVAFAVVTLAYFPVACAGYAAFGSQVNADVLLSVSRPTALIAIANLMVVVHIAASYQVCLPSALCILVFMLVWTRCKLHIACAYAAH